MHHELAELILVLVSGVFEIEIPQEAAVPIPPPEEITNTRALGNVLYTRYAFLFQGAGFILLVAMVGAIVLTHRRRSDVRRQKISEQVARDPKVAVTLTDIEPGKEGTWKSD